jgi:tRNA(fMet)-specific endonuclease VapC
MSYLLDSDWIVDWLKGKAPALSLIQELVAGPLAISVITYGETFEGIYYGQSRTEIERTFRRFLYGVTVLPITRPIARRFGIIRGDLRQRGLVIGDPDVLIAATALHYDLTLVTQNFRHFQRIPGLALYRP